MCIFCSASSLYLNQCWIIVNCTLRNKLRWYFNQNKKKNIPFTKMHLKISSVKWWPCCSGRDEFKKGPLEYSSFITKGQRKYIYRTFDTTPCLLGSHDTAQPLYGLGCLDKPYSTFPTRWGKHQLLPILTEFPFSINLLSLPKGPLAPVVNGGDVTHRCESK